MQREIIIGSRGSKLALWQANHFKRQLTRNGHLTRIEVIKTKGDQIQHLSFDKIEGKGFFTSELEQALVEEKIDIAVHSLKDLPTVLPDALHIAGYSEREDPADVLVIKREKLDRSEVFWLKPGAKVGTSSARRRSQLLFFRSDLNIEPIRGNVPTRVGKLQTSDLDAIVLAQAGLNRLHITEDENLVFKRLHPREFIPSPGQGILAFQCRQADRFCSDLIADLADQRGGEIAQIEREILALMQGGCQTPVGIYCEIDALFTYHVWAYAELEQGHPMKAKVSLNTRTNIAETVLDQLKSN